MAPAMALMRRMRRWRSAFVRRRPRPATVAGVFLASSPFWHDHEFWRWDDVALSAGAGERFPRGVPLFFYHSEDDSVPVAHVDIFANDCRKRWFGGRRDAITRSMAICRRWRAILRAWGKQTAASRFAGGGSFSSDVERYFFAPFLSSLFCLGLRFSLLERI
jgi:hypothetical protein